MADAKLTALTAVSAPALDDLAYLVDVSDTTDDAAGSSRQVALYRLLGLLNHVCQGRLTLTSGTPVTTSDVTTSTNVYFTPYMGNLVALYDGTRWKLYSFSELTLALGTVVPYQAYDVFLYDNAGTLTLEQLEWANATATMTMATPCVVTWTGHGLATGNSVTFTTTGGLYTGVSANTQYWVTVTGTDTFKLSTSLINVGAGTFINTSGSQSGTHTAHSPTNRATALTTQDGVTVKSGATTRRYLGTFVAISTSQTTDTTTQRMLWNKYNRVKRTLFRHDSTSSWTYGSSAWRQARATASNLVEGVVGELGSPVELAVQVMLGAAAVYGSVGIGEDTTTAVVADCLPCQGDATSSVSGNATTVTYRYPPVGYHGWTWLEYRGTGTVTFYGAVNQHKSGIWGTIDG